MSSFVSMIGVLLLVFVVCKTIVAIRRRKAFERIEIDGQTRSLESLLVEVLKEAELPAEITPRLTPYMFTAATAIRKALRKEEMPYQALVAYFAAGALRGLAKEDKSNAERLLAYADQCKTYAENRRNGDA